MSIEETPPIIRWLHRYIFRGLGWVFLAAVLLPAISFTATFLPGEGALVTGVPGRGESLTNV
jgi:hypothetical protein